MTFEEILDQAIAMLQRRGRLTYGTLKRQFQLDDAALEDLTNELIKGQRLARAVRSGAAPGARIVGGGRACAREERTGHPGRRRAQERSRMRAHPEILPVGGVRHAQAETCALKALSARAIFHATRVARTEREPS